MVNIMKLIKSIGLILPVIFLSYSVVFSKDTALTKETLRGLKGVHVNIFVSNKLIQTELSESQVRKDVEKKLREAGIKTVSIDDSITIPGMPWLKLAIEGAIKDDVILYLVELSISQRALLVSNDSETIVHTWSVKSFGYTQKTEKIQSSVNDLTDMFVNAYLSGNKVKKQEGLQNLDKASIKAVFTRHDSH